MNFDTIKKMQQDLDGCLSIQALQEFRHQNGIVAYYSESNYPKLHLSFDEEELKELNALEINQRGFTHIDPNTLDARGKLMYALLWKTNSLPKARHILNGLNGDKLEGFEEDSLVLLQFGRHLANRSTEPIIDQHTLRAYCCMRADTAEEFTRYRKLGQLARRHKKQVLHYIEWFCEQTRKASGDQEAFGRELDVLMFDLGKMLKVKA